MTPQVWQFLLSDSGQALLNHLTLTADNHVQLATQLRRTLTAEQTHAVLETLLLRGKARAKFSRADEMYFTREALEQASAEVVARHRAQRFVQNGLKTIADLGCGIGGDALALAEQAVVIGIDQDEMRLRFARENVCIYGRGAQFLPLQADLRQLSPLAVEGVFFDPARRDQRGRRLLSVRDYHPPLSLIDTWRDKVPHAAVKVSPGVNYAELPATAEAEFIALDGEVKECLLWYGALRGLAARRATLLPEGHVLTDEPLAAAIPITQPKAFLYEPNGAVIRAHLVEQMAQRFNLSKIDHDIAYLTADTLHQNAFGRPFAVQDVFPFQLKRLRHYLQTRRIGQVTIKKRGSPLQIEYLQKQLRLRGDQQALLFLTQVQGQHTVIVSTPIKKP